MAQKNDSPVRALVQRASLALRSRDLPLALETYAELEELQPTDPRWPERRAHVSSLQGRREDELSGLDRAAELNIDAGLIVQAIANCNRILALEPGHARTLDRLDLLYTAPAQADDDAKPANDADLPVSRQLAAHADSDAPLDELVLTEVLAGSEPAQMDDIAQAGIALIPIDPNDVSSGQLDLRLDDGPTSDNADTTQPLPTPQEQLERTPLFGSLSAASLRQLVGLVDVIALAENEVLFREGDRGTTLYVVVSGAVVPIAEGEPRKKLAVLSEGEFFGESGLVTNQPRNATIEAMVDTQLLAIDRRVMWQLLRDNPDVFKVLLRFLRQRLIDRLVSTSPFFAAFGRAERSAVAKQFRLLEVKDGSVIAEQGRAPEGLFIVLAGHAQVIHVGYEGDKVLSTLGPGDLFGELSTGEPEPSDTAIVATGKCWMLLLPHRRFQRILEKNPRLNEIISHAASEHERHRGRLWASAPRRDQDLGDL